MNRHNGPSGGEKRKSRLEGCKGVGGVGGLFPLLKAMTYPCTKTSVADETTHIERGVTRRGEGPPFLPIEDRNIKE
jgi:hypothetical protein